MWIISTLYGDNYTELKRKHNKSMGTADSFLLSGVVEVWWLQSKLEARAGLAVVLFFTEAGEQGLLLLFLRGGWMHSQDHCQSPFNSQSQISRCMSSSSGSSPAFCLPFPLIPTGSMISTDPWKVQLGATTHSCSICYQRMNRGLISSPEKKRVDVGDDREPAPSREVGGDQIFPVGWGTDGGWEKGSQAGVAFTLACSAVKFRSLLNCCQWCYKSW